MYTENLFSSNWKPLEGGIVKPRRGDPILAGGERSVTPGNGTPNLLTLMGWPERNTDIDNGEQMM